MSEQDPRKLADGLEQQADELEAHGDELDRRIDETRQEWERNRGSEAVPGANPPESGAEDETEA